MAHEYSVSIVRKPLAIATLAALFVASLTATDPAAAETVEDGLPEAESAATFVSEELFVGEGTLPIELGETSENGVTVPEELDQPITVETVDQRSLTFDVPTAPDALPEVTDTGDIVVASANEGADLLIQEIDPQTVDEVATGVRTIITIDSWDVEPVFEFTPHIPDGGSIEVDESGALLILTADGEISSVLGEAWAFDAAGVEVPTWYEVEDGKIFQYVDHISAEYTYPVVADPAWFIPLIVAGGRIIVQRVVAATVQAARQAAVKGTQGSRVAQLKSFTKANYRHNLVVWTLRQPGTRCDAHHTLPQAYRPTFERIGFKGDNSIDHPRYLVWWEATDHRRKAGSYNKDWGNWLSRNPNANVSKTLNFRTEMVRKYKPWC